MIWKLIVGVVLLLWCVMWLLIFHRRGYEIGFKEGLQEARKEWDWWLEAEKGVDKAKQEMWEGES